MFSFLRSATRWVGQHSLPAAAVTVLLLGAAGGGVGYALAAQPTAAAPVSPTAPTPHSPSTTAPAAKAKPKGAASAAGGAGQALLDRALEKLSAELGVPVATLRTELKTQSIDHVVTAAGKDPAVIEQDILAQLKTRADKAVAAGRITAQQEQAFLGRAKAEVDKLLADPPAQRAADLKTLLQALRARHAASPAATPAPG